MIVVVSGGRKLTNFYKTFCFEELDEFNKKYPIQIMRVGRAKCWDTWCEEWALYRGIQIDPYPAEWDKLNHPSARIVTRQDGSRYDADAGLRRNIRMLDDKGLPDWLIAGPGGVGTAHMRGQAKLRGVPIWECNPFKG